MNSNVLILALDARGLVHMSSVHNYKTPTIRAYTARMANAKSNASTV